ncbi:MAG TPA: universal stress protein [Stellaceae bacterium]|nr:universal stress protein [Stellaceae bacterium]
MAYKDLLVVLDADQSTGERISVAATLAARFEAHLVGLYVAMPPARRAEYALLDIGILDIPYLTNPEKSRERVETTRALFEDVTARQKVSAEWRLASGYPAGTAALHGRYADLITLGQLDPYDGQVDLLRARPEEVAMLAGRPVLVVPYAGHFDRVGRRVVIGWDASREAARAVNDAMRLLAGAEVVTVLTIDPEQTPYGHGEIPGADIALHLARHGVKAQVERTVSAGIGVGNTLLSRAADLEADLLVMGAYGHSRVRELLLGGATRTVLTSMTLPVLMSH